MLKKFMFIVLLVGLPLLYIFDNDMLDLADFKCQIARHTKIGYPVRVCSLSFDDKGVMGKVFERL